MTDFIYEALRRPDLKTWNPKLVVEYHSENINRSIYKDVLEVERIEGRDEGRIEGSRDEEKRKIIVAMINEKMSNKQIIKIADTNENNVQKIRNGLSNEERDDLRK